MTMQATSYRYQLESRTGGKGSKHTCPGCRKPKQFTRYIDTKTGDLLPDEFGICNRTDKCGYHLSPYHRSRTGLTYAEIAYQRTEWKETYLIQRPRPPQPNPQVVPIPPEVFRQTLNAYDRNNFATLLRQRFGMGVATELIERFNIGTSAYWPGGCVFWLIDEAQKVLGGQVAVFDNEGHTAKEKRDNGEVFRYTRPFHWVYEQALKAKSQAIPDWLQRYKQSDVPKYPIPFGLHQLANDRESKPIAIVEAPATAVFCSGYFPEFTWLALCGLSYLNAERLASLKCRKIRLFPDLSPTGKAYNDWKQKADELKGLGFSVEVSSYLENLATPEQKAKQYDLRDFLLEQWQGYPPDWDSKK